MNVAYSASPGSADNVTSPIQRGPQIVEHKPDRTSESIRTRSFARTGASDRYRREADAAVRSSGGPLTEPTPAVQPSRREPLFMSSRPEDSHLRALPDPYVNLSIHTAPYVRPFP